MVKGGDELARGRIPELGGVVSACSQDPSTVGTKPRIMIETGLSQPFRGSGSPFRGSVQEGWSKEATSLPEAASQSLAVLSQLAVRIRAPSGLKAA